MWKMSYHSQKDSRYVFIRSAVSIKTLPYLSARQVARVCGENKIKGDNEQNDANATQQGG